VLSEYAAAGWTSCQAAVYDADEAKFSPLLQFRAKVPVDVGRAIRGWARSGNDGTDWKRDMNCQELADRIQRLQPGADTRDVARLCLLLANTMWLR
jgi:hypothetical protein